MPDQVRVKALLFASYADAYGAREVDLQFSTGATVADVVHAIRSKPGNSLPDRPLVAVNHSYADYHQTLRSGDEVALIPPVAGG